MTPDERALLEKTYRLSQENNDMIRKMYRISQVGRVMKALYWGVIIVLSFGAYYFVQPYLTMMQGIGGSVSQSVDSVKSINDLISGLNQ